MIHCGESGEDWRILHKRLRRIDFLSDRQLSLQAAKQTMTENVCAEEAFDTFLKPYSAILVDEAHLLSVEQLKILEECKKQIPIIFSSDTEDMISPEELDREIPQRLAEPAGCAELSYDEPYPYKCRTFFLYSEHAGSVAEKRAEGLS